VAIIRKLAEIRVCEQGIIEGVRRQGLCERDMGMQMAWRWYANGQRDRLAKDVFVEA
jgi:hypothetical protein